MSHSNDKAEAGISNVFEDAELSSKFVVGKELGRGANSIVYEAEELLLQRKVALKVMKFQSDELAKERFLREARVCTSLKHPSIVQVYSYGAKGDEAFLAMELLPGHTLEQLIKDVKTLTKERFESIFMPILSALELAHENELLHRDIKPANIMIVEGPSKTVVKLLDFGLSKGVGAGSSLSKTLTVADTGVGTPAYMSPEQCRGGKCDFSSDIYSLACVMYETLVGQPPFVGNSPVETMYLHMNQKATFPARPDTGAQIPVRLMEVVLQGLEKDPSSRPASVAEFKQLLRDALDSGDNRILRRVQLKLPYIVAMGAFLLVLFVIAFTCISNKPKPAETLVRVAPPALVRNWGSIFKEAVLYRSAGRFEESLLLLKGAEIIYKQRSEKNALIACQSEILETYLRYSESLKDQSRAEAKAREALKYLNSILDLQPEAVVMRVNIPSQIARVYRDMNEPEKGVVRLEEICSCLKRDKVEGVQFARVEGACAEACYLSGKYSDAENYARHSLHIFDEGVFGRTDPEGTKAAIVYIKALSKLKRNAEARKVLDKTKQQLLNRTYKHDGIQNALLSMAEYLESQNLASKAKALRAAYKAKTEAYDEALKRSESLKDIFIPQK